MRIVVFGICLLYAVAVNASMQIVQIGGGNKISNSQGQIEDNVIWLNRILRRTGNSVRNYFASGQGDEKDVALFVDAEEYGAMAVIARVFDDPAAVRISYRHNRVEDLSGSMRKSEISASLAGILSDLSKGDEFFLIYNGHGGDDSKDVRDNYLKLWGEEKLTVSEVDKLFDLASESVTIRFVFPQCFSGGFYQLIYDTPFSETIGTQKRCGFFAESPYDESEGCSLSTNRDEYRDYSTYFFAPLNGKTRNGHPLEVVPDTDADGVITFSEAHRYAIKAGHSKDLSRSTSEVFLERWAPWYLRWMKNKDNEKSQYWRIAEFVAKREGVKLDDNALGLNRRDLNRKLDELGNELNACTEQAEKLSGVLRKSVLSTWPELMHPYTSRYVQVINEQSQDIADRLKSHELYSELVDAQENCVHLNAEILQVEREKAQIEKVLRYKRLAMLEFFFERYASEDEQANYRSLQTCENGVFFDSAVLPGQ